MSEITITIGDDEIYEPKGVLEDLDEKCPDPYCGHRLTNHVVGVGCQVAWSYDIEGGLALGQGCECLLSHANLSTDEKTHWKLAIAHYAPPQGVPITDHELRQVSNQIRREHY